jgi:hypothetical protein
MEKKTDNFIKIIMDKSSYIGRWNVDSNFVLETRKRMFKPSDLNKGRFVIVNMGGVYKGKKYIKGDIVVSDGLGWYHVHEDDYTAEMKALKIELLNKAYEKAFGSPDNFSMSK